MTSASTVRRIPRRSFNALAASVGMLGLALLMTLLAPHAFGMSRWAALALWVLGGVAGLFVARSDALARDVSAYRQWLLGEADVGPKPSRTPSLRTVLVLAAILAVIVAVLLSPGAARTLNSLLPLFTRATFDLVYASAILLFLGWASPAALLEALRMHKTEVTVQDEIDRRLHPSADPPQDAAGMRDAWESATSRKRRVSVVVTVSCLALWVVGAGVTWVLIGFRDRLPASDMMLVTLFSAWTAAWLAAAGPPMVWMYWERTWASQEAAMLANLDSQGLLDYLNRDLRPRLTMDEWLVRTSKDGGPGVRYVVIPAVALLGVSVVMGHVVALWFLVASAVRGGHPEAWVVVSIYLGMLPWTLAVVHTIAMVVARQVRIFRRLRESEEATHRLSDPPLGA